MKSAGTPSHSTVASVLAGRNVAAGQGLRPAVGKARSVPLLYMTGAPSHIDTFDPKPDAPAEVRGTFGTIATIYRALGIERDSQLRDQQGRPLQLNSGEPIEPIYSGASV